MRRCVYCNRVGVRLYEVQVGTYLIALCAKCNKLRKKSYTVR